MVLASEEAVPDILEEGRLVGRHADIGIVSGWKFGGGFAVTIRGANLLSNDKQAVTRSAEWGTGDEGEDWFVGFVDKSGDVGRFDDFATGHLVSVALRFVVDVD